jgi:hypothetical protein
VGLFLLTFNYSFTIFSIESVDINKIMVVFYHLPVCPWISGEKIILTLTNFLYPFFQIFQGKILKSKMDFNKKNSKRSFSPSYMGFRPSEIS